MTNEDLKDKRLRMANARRYRHQKPTNKQIRALHLIATKGYSKRKAMIEAGYSVTTASHNAINPESFLEVLEKVKYELLKDPDIQSGFLVKKFKEWMNATKETKFGVVPDYSTQFGGYDRYKELTEGFEKSTNGRKGVTKKITFEEFIEN